MRILTFNWHEPYICALARTGHRFDVIEREKGGWASWMYEQRPLPTNASIVREATARQRLRAGDYDAVIAHNLQDLGWVSEYRVPKVLLFHNMLTTEIALGGDVVAVGDYRQQVRALLATHRDLSCVFISTTKRDDWQLEGDVITPGIDLLDYGGYRGDERRVLRVGNMMRQRDLMLGFSMQQRVVAALPSTLIGLGTEADGGRFSRGWDDLREIFRSHRVYLNTTVDGFEDGYNLAMLEAMATGMPVVTTPNRTSPIVDGKNGFVSSDEEALASRLATLLDDPVQAARLGDAARETVRRQFGIDAFVDKWNAVLTRASSQRPVRRPRLMVVDGKRSERLEPRRKILLAYVSYPATTARYIERSLRKRHDVVTIGPAIDDGIVRRWNLEALPEPIVPHDVPAPYNVDVEAFVASLPASWRPDLFLWIDSVPGYRPRGITRLDCPTACYLIDTHLNFPVHQEWAWRFDHTFVVHRQYCAELAAAGCSRVSWLPIACDPEVHGRVDVPKRYDIGFVGSLNQERRRHLIERLERRWPVHVERSFLRDMARTFSASRIVFNNAVKDDLNMRVFEAMASGSLLVTDRAPGSGLEDMFGDGEHLALYDDDTLEERVEYYLAHEDEREQIAAAGRAEVLRWHTYDHRAAALTAQVFGHAEPQSYQSPPTIVDPVLRDAALLVDAHRPDAALSLLDLCGRQRELSVGEQWIRGRLEAACLDRLGRFEDARARLQQAIRLLPLDQRQQLADAAWR